MSEVLLFEEKLLPSLFETSMIYNRFICYVFMIRYVYMLYDVLVMSSILFVSFGFSLASLFLEVILALILQRYTMLIGLYVICL